MKINRMRILSILIIALICLSLVLSRKNKKTKKVSKKLHRLMTEASSMVNSKGFDWEKDPFLKHLKNQVKYNLTANKKDKWVLIKMVIGKTIQLLGVKDEDALTSLKQFDEKKQLKVFDLIMKFQRTMNLDSLKPLATDYTTKGLTVKNFIPDKRMKILSFLNMYVRQPGI